MVNTVEHVKQNLENSTFIKSVPQVRELCSPLYRALDIKFFYFSRAYFNGSRFLYSDTKDWVKDYFNEKHYENELLNFPNELKDKDHMVSIWGGCESDHESCAFWARSKEKYNLANFIWITWVFKKYAEVFGFGINYGQDHVIQRLLFNIDPLKRFSQYFIDKGHSLIKEGEKQKFHVTPPKSNQYSNTYIWGIKDTSKQDFIQQTSMDKVYLKGKYRNVALSIEEAQTILLVVQSYKYSEVAKFLSISEHTVKYRMNSIREKMNAKSKNDLIKIFIQNDLARFCEMALFGEKRRIIKP